MGYNVYYGEKFTFTKPQPGKNFPMIKRSVINFGKTGNEGYQKVGRIFEDLWNAKNTETGEL